MKIDRLIGILSILQQKEKTTAKDLADKFEVSVRTITRDIEDLCKAGIPIVTFQGKGGGISIMDGYQLDRSVLSNEDMKSIITALKGLDSISKDSKYNLLMDKVSIKSHEAMVNNPIIIDLSGWDKSCLANKIEMLKIAIKENKRVAFKYFSETGESIRTIEPKNIIFQWSNWYVWGYCLLRKKYRMFKLTRIIDLEITDAEQQCTEVVEFERHDTWNEHMSVKATVKFDVSVKWRIVDEFGIESLEINETGDIIVRHKWSSIYSLFSQLLSFADKAEIIEPAEYKEEYLKLLNKIKAKYE